MNTVFTFSSLFQKENVTEASTNALNKLKVGFWPTKDELNHLNILSDPRWNLVKDHVKKSLSCTPVLSRSQSKGCLDDMRLRELSINRHIDMHNSGDHGRGRGDHGRGRGDHGRGDRGDRDRGDHGHYDDNRSQGSGIWD